MSGRGVGCQGVMCVAMCQCHGLANQTAIFTSCELRVSNVWPGLFTTPGNNTGIPTTSIEDSDKLFTLGYFSQVASRKMVSWQLMVFRGEDTTFVTMCFDKK